jgi:hypothetical protein
MVKHKVTDVLYGLSTDTQPVTPTVTGGSLLLETDSGRMNMHTGSIWQRLYASPSFKTSPTQLTSDQDDYNPTGLSTSQVVRLDGDSSFRSIRSLAGGVDGSIIYLRNVGSNSILLIDESQTNTGTTAANRFAFDGHNIPIFPKQQVAVIYDGTLSRWVLAQDKSIRPPTSYGFVGFHDFLRTNNNDWISTTTPSGGSINTQTPSTPGHHTGVAEITLGTSTTGSGAHISATNSIMFGSSWYHHFTAWFKILDLSDATDRYSLRIGYVDSGSAESADCACFRYSDNVNSGKWERVTRSNSTETAVDTTVTADTNWHRFDIYTNPAATNVEFFIDGTSRGSNTTNIPTGTSRVFGAGWMFLKSAGTTDIASFQIDALQYIAYAPTKRV